MATQILSNQAWRRKHDAKTKVAKSAATVHCVDDTVSVIKLCMGPAEGGEPPPGRRLKAAGSHWSLSDSTLSDGEFIETNWPPGTPPVPRSSGLADVDMLDLISGETFDYMMAYPPQRPDALMSDPCFDGGAAPGAPPSLFFVHLKAGTRIYEAYSLLDRSPAVTTALAAELNAHLAAGPFANAYDGPWAFQTLGSSGGQTVFGALTTGTHGADYRQKPISDAVLALHLVTDGGAHYWIEPEHSGFEFRLTDDDKLNAKYRNLVADGRATFRIFRDDDIFNAVTVGVGRFGVVTSVVLRVVPQYCLHEHRRLDQWSNVKKRLISPALHHAFDGVHFAGTVSEVTTDLNTFGGRFGPPGNFQNRFLQIGVSLSPDGDNDHLCGVSQRWFYPPSGPEARDPSGELRGRAERGTAAVAGLVGSYDPPDDDSEPGGNASFISRACASANFLEGLFRAAVEELEKIIADNVVPATGIAVAALGIGAGAVATAAAAAGALCPALAAAALAIKLLAEALDGPGDPTLAETADTFVKAIMENPLIPKEVGLMVVRGVFNALFRMEQANCDYVALSYAVMETHDYVDRSCYGNAESIEVFLDAARPDLYCAYVDAVLSFEAFQQEQNKRFSVGYVSLRFVLGSDALIAPARFPETVVIEVAALREATGSVDFVMNAAAVARNPIFGASFHWGQFNPATRPEVEQQFGTRLLRWRAALALLTDNGTREGFSSAFTQRTGLEPF